VIGTSLLHDVGQAAGPALFSRTTPSARCQVIASKDDGIMQPIRERAQQTIATPAGVHGVGYVTGQAVQLRFVPAPIHTGIVFARTDLGPHARLRAHISQVTGVQRRTTLGHGSLSVSLVEHVLAALSGLLIDNCLVELNAPEPPGLDGSAQAFVDALQQAGTVIQPARKIIWGMSTSVTVQQSDAALTLHPADGPILRASYLLDYGDRSPIARQSCHIDVTPAAFLQEIARCRTFVTQEEAVLLRQQGLGSRTQVGDLVIFGPRGPIDNKLQFANEPARHKVLDLIGDLALLGEDVCGHIVAYRSGHALNVELVHELHRRLEHARRQQRAVA
jgi:UDP-3-O-[3-hydroxymyristoyl] N-acetylglucosamine deacetylase